MPTNSRFDGHSANDADDGVSEPPAEHLERTAQRSAASAAALGAHAEAGEDDAHSHADRPWEPLAVHLDLVASGATQRSTARQLTRPHSAILMLRSGFVRPARLTGRCTDYPH